MGKMRRFDAKRNETVEMEVNLSGPPDKLRLSITGAVYAGKTCNDNYMISCGQVQEELRRVFPEFSALLPWHLNDMKAGCEHQRAEKWEDRPLDPSKPTNAYVKHPDGHSGWNMLTWVPENQGGLLSKACAVCGYKYGTSWLHEPLPADILEMASNFGQ